MARQARDVQPLEVIEPAAEVVQQNLQTADTLALATQQQDSRVRAVALQLGYQLPADCTDPDLIQRDIAANMRRSVEACLEVGRGLAVLKEACGHGNFIARLEVLGLDRGVAARFIQAATKFSNVPTSAHLTKAIGTQSKLLEMLVLNDEELKELELTGQTGELKLDDVATMSVKELRAALREARAAKDKKIADLEATLAARDKVLADKGAYADQLATQLAKLRDGDPDEAARLAAEREQAAAKALHDAALTLLGYISRYRVALADVLAEPTASRETLGHETTRWLFQQLAEMTAEHGWMVNFQDTVQPTWVTELTPDQRALAGLPLGAED